MTTHGPYHVSQPWLGYLVDGQKPVEGRKGSPKWQKIRTGDYIIFYDVKAYKFQVTDFKTYDSIRSYLQHEGVSNALPGIEFIDEGVSIYRQWTSLTEEKKYGFVGIHLKYLGLVKKQ